jgi:hypothetical protein
VGENTKGIIIWIIFLAIIAAICLIARRLKKQTIEQGIETNGVVSRIVDRGGPDEIDMCYYARYRTPDGEEIEGLITNPKSSLYEGQQVRIKYHPKLKVNARIIY